MVSKSCSATVPYDNPLLLKHILVEDAWDLSKIIIRKLEEEELYGFPETGNLKINFKLRTKWQSDYQYSISTNNPEINFEGKAGYFLAEGKLMVGAVIEGTYSYMLCGISRRTERFYIQFREEFNVEV